MIHAFSFPPPLLLLPLLLSFLTPRTRWRHDPRAWALLCSFPQQRGAYAVSKVAPPASRIFFSACSFCVVWCMRFKVDG